MVRRPEARRAGRVLGLLGLRPGELPTVALLFTWCFAGVGAIWLARAVRDTLFLANVSAARLPYMYVASPITVSLVGLGYARFADHLRRERLVVGTALLFGVGFAAVRLAMGVGTWLFYVLYVSVDVLGSVVAMQLWTVAGDALNARDGKRLFGLIAAGGTVANIVLGFGVRPIARRSGAENLLFVCTALLALIAVLALRLARRHGGRLGPPRPRRVVPGAAGPTGLDTPGAGHLRLVAVIIVCSVVTVTTIDFQFKTITSVALHGDRVAMVSFFGMLSGVTGAISLLIQLLVTGRLLARAGVAGALLVLPLALALGASGLIFLPGLAAATFCKGADATLRYTLNDAGMQLLYVPVPSRVRSRVKATLDAVVKPGTEALVGVALLGYRQLGAGLTALAAISAAAALAWAVVVARLRPVYVRSLRETLRRRRLELDGIAGRDAMTAATSAATSAIEKTFGGGDDAELTRALELAPAALASLVVPLLSHPDAAVRAAACGFCLRTGSTPAELRALLDDTDPQVRTAARLVLEPEALATSDDGDDRARAAARVGPDRLRLLLDDPEMRVRLAAIASAGSVPSLAATLARRLGDAGEGRAAAAALAARGGTEELLARVVAGEGEEPRARRHAAWALGRLGTPAAAAALLDAAATHTDETVRDSLCKALATAHRKDTTLEVRRDAILAACRRELEAAYRAVAAAEGLGHAEAALANDGTRVELSTLPATPEGAARLVGTTLRERWERAAARMLWLLQPLYPGAGLPDAQRNLADVDPARRANAAEVLEATLDRQLGKLVVALVDDSPRALKLTGADGVVPVPRQGRDAWIAELLGDESPWMVACAAYYAGLHGIAAVAPKLRSLAAHPNPLVSHEAAAAASRFEVAA